MFISNAPAFIASVIRAFRDKKQQKATLQNTDASTIPGNIRVKSHGQNKIATLNNLKNDYED